MKFEIPENGKATKFRVGTNELKNGGDKVAKVDCPEKGFTIAKGDILVVASDGLQFLSNEEIEEIVLECQDETATEIAAELLEALITLDDPHQDNLSFSVIKVNWTDVAEAELSDDRAEPLKLGVVNG